MRGTNLVEIMISAKLTIYIFALLLVVSPVVSGQDRVSTETRKQVASIFKQYMKARRNLDLAELMEFSDKLANKKDVTEQERNLLKQLSDKIDVSHILALKAGDQEVLKECLRDLECRLSTLSTMQSWAITKYKINHLVPNKSGDFVILFYSGTDGNGVLGNGEITFIRVDDQWKISSESFSPVRNN